jgi:starch phosphorylase
MNRTDAGSIDIERAAADLARRLPERLSPFARIAYNYGWCWQPFGRHLFEAIDWERFQQVQRNPVRLLQETSAAALARAADDDDLVARAEALLTRLQDERTREPAFDSGLDPAHPVAFLCAEYAIHVSLPIYSGGLGALAGDILKEASDLAVPMVAIGLMYNRGYFHQRIDPTGWQQEFWLPTDPARLPAALVTDDQDEVLTIPVPIGEDEVQARVWRVDVGRVPLFLLDTDFPANTPVQRWITGRLYEGDSDVRIAQYTLLGVGGIRVLRALGIDPGVVHMNEGHPWLAPVELALKDPARDDKSLSQLLQDVHKHTVFTTHTPVPAGNDTYPAAQMAAALAGLAKADRVAVEDVIALGQTNPADSDSPFGITQAALRLSDAANGVSRRHGQVAREMWNELWPDKQAEDVPIGYVTNGVHVPTWIGGPMRELIDRHLGEDWFRHSDELTTWGPISQVPNAELWAARREQRAQLVEFLARRSVEDRLQRFEPIASATAAARALSSEVLTIGFARRVATYKRLELLLADLEWAMRMLGGETPIQLVVSGKAHPRDDEGKRTLAKLFAHKDLELARERVVFVEDYDLQTAAMLVRGCDVWLNLPRAPMEASGTSGMKAAVNGGLNLSVLDGWWDEAYAPGNGWAIPGQTDVDPAVQDAVDGATLRKLIEEEVVPLFYDRGDDGLPHGWLAMVKASIAAHAPRFSATRMVRDYIYGPYVHQ